MLWPRRHSPPLGTVGPVANFWGMPQILALGARRAPYRVLTGFVPCGWNRAYSGVRFWRWWVSQGNWPSGSQDLMYPPRSVGAGFAFRSALALRMAVAR